MSRRITRICTTLLYFGLFSSELIAQAQEPQELHLEEIVMGGMSLPVTGTNAGDGSGRLFVCEQAGRIRIIQDGELLNQPFLDIRRLVVPLRSGFDERGLLGLAFHPNYAENGRFFVYYSAPVSGADHQSVIAEYRVSDDDPNRADPDSERRILTFNQPNFNHNSGQLAFGPDGMLYIGSGDGGGSGDPQNHAQRLNTILGKILRIDVDSEEPYAVPPDNPFVDEPDALPEIWAYGLRNPWRFSFDWLTGRLFAADVGQNRMEEINIIERGGNYGWRIMEGTLCYNPPRDCDTDGLILPIAEYPNPSVGISITGGYVYRGASYASLYGKYVCADYRSVFFIVTEQEDGTWDLRQIPTSDSETGEQNRWISSFMQADDGELYVMYVRGGSFFSGSARVARVTVPGDEPVGVRHWRQHE